MIDLGRVMIHFKKMQPLCLSLNKQKQWVRSTGQNVKLRQLNKSDQKRIQLIENKQIQQQLVNEVQQIQLQSQQKQQLARQIQRQSDQPQQKQQQSINKNKQTIIDAIIRIKIQLRQLRNGQYSKYHSFLTQLNSIQHK